MPSYLQRYIAGEHEQVWDELLALGAAVRDEPLYSDALAVARETMTRARHNVELIVKRLKQNGYVFIMPDEDIYQPPPNNATEEIAKLEQMAGTIPLSIRMWFELVGMVNLMGTHPSWKVTGYAVVLLAPQDLWQASHNKTAIETEPLHVEGIKDQFGWYEWWLERKLPIEKPFSLVLAEDTAMRSGFSGGDMVIMDVPNLDADAPIYREGRQSGETFVQNLRRTFEWGGFPGLAYADRWVKRLKDDIAAVDTPSNRRARAKAAEAMRDLASAIMDQLPNIFSPLTSEQVTKVREAIPAERLEEMFSLEPPALSSVEEAGETYVPTEWLAELTEGLLPI